MITIKNLNVSYRSTKPIFRDLNLHLRAGHIYGLLGKNGARKSTLLKNMVGLIYSHSGEIKILGEDVKLRTPSLLQEVCYIQEELYMPNGMSLVGSNMRNLDRFTLTATNATYKMIMPNPEIAASPGNLGLVKTFNIHTQGNSNISLLGKINIGYIGGSLSDSTFINLPVASLKKLIK